MLPSRSITTADWIALRVVHRREISVLREHDGNRSQVLSQILLDLLIRLENVDSQNNQALVDEFLGNVVDHCSFCLAVPTKTQRTNLTSERVKPAYARRSLSLFAKIGEYVSRCAIRRLAVLPFTTM
jgi:hypothetical protein